MSMTEEHSVHDPVAVEQKIEETANRIAAGVKIVTAAERKMKAKRRDFDLAWAHTIKNRRSRIPAEVRGGHQDHAAPGRGRERGACLQARDPDR